MTILFPYIGGSYPSEGGGGGGGSDYIFQNGIEEISGGRVELKIAPGAHAGNVTLTADYNGLAASVDLAGSVVYQGTWDITSATSYAGITLPVKKGYLYCVEGEGPVTIGGIEWNAGDYLLVNEDVNEGGSLDGKVGKIDNSESGLPTTPTDEAYVIDGGEAKNLFEATEVTETVYTKQKLINYNDYTTNQKVSTSSASVGYLTPVDQVSLQGKSLYSIDLEDVTSGVLDVYLINTGVTSGVLTVNEFPSDLVAMEAVATKMCTLHLHGGRVQRSFKLDGTDPDVTDINQNFVEDGWIKVPSGYFLGFKDYNETGGQFGYGGVAAGSLTPGFCYLRGNAGFGSYENLGIGISIAIGQEVTKTNYAFDKYLEDTENNTINSNIIKEAKEEVDNLFDVTTTSGVEVVSAVDFASYSAYTQQYGQSSTAGFFTVYDQRGIQGKHLHSIGIMQGTVGGAMDIYITQLNETGKVLSINEAPSTVSEFNETSQRLCTVQLQNANSIFRVFKLDGTDSGVTNINSNFVDETGYVKVPVGYYISTKTWNTSNAPGFKYGGTNTGTLSPGWFYYGGDGYKATNDGNLGLLFNTIEATEDKHYNFDDKLITTTEETSIEFTSPVSTVGLNKSAPATNAMLGGNGTRMGFIPLGANNTIQSSMNGKYLKGISYVGSPGTSAYFVLVRVEDNTASLAGESNADIASIVSGSESNNYNGHALFKITPSSDVDQSYPTVYKLDGTDVRVEILNTELYDNEQKGFLWDKTWLVGICSLGFTNTDSINPNGTYPARYCTASERFITATLTGFGSAVSPGSLLMTFYTDVEVTTVKETVNSKVLGDIKDKVDTIFEYNQVSPLKDKYISIVGDSISTYQGWSNISPGSTSAAVYYPHGSIDNVNKTYWKKLVDRTGAKLLVNNSWSGSRCSNTGSGSVVSTTNDRCKQLGKNGIDPDYIIINIGTNDFDYGVQLGTWNGRGEDYPANPDTTAPTTFREAYSVMMARIKKNYPLAKVYCCTVPCGNRCGGGYNEKNSQGVYLVEFNDAIREIATAYGSRVIDLASSGLNYYTLSTLYCDYNASSQGGEGDALHPNEAGMERYYELIRDALEDEATNTTSCPRNSALMKGTAVKVHNADNGTVTAAYNDLVSQLETRGVISSTRNTSTLVKDSIYASNDIGSGLKFVDSNGKSIVEFTNGNIKTENFDSSNLPSTYYNNPFLDLTGKTVGFLGDSITAGSGASSTSKRYSSVFCRLAGCKEINLGVGGTCIAANTKNGATNQRFITRVTGTGYPDIIKGLDLLFVFGGTNDFSYDIKAVGTPFTEETITGNDYIGTKRKIYNTDNESFSGAVIELIRAIKNIYNTLPIVLITPLNRGRYGNPERPSSIDSNANGNYLDDFTNAIKTIGRFYEVPVFDSNQHFPYNLASLSTRFSSDHLHPNDLGHAVLAKALYRWTISNLDIAYVY